jgi:hypothetical protein
MITEFDDAIATRLDDQNFQANNDTDTFYMQDDDTDSNTGELHTTPTVEEYGDLIVPDLIDVKDDGLVDKYLNAELMLDVGTREERRGRVVKRAKGTAGEVIGRAHSNPLFDTRQYIVEFTNGTVEHYFANVRAEHVCTGQFGSKAV